MEEGAAEAEDEAALAGHRGPAAEPEPVWCWQELTEHQQAQCNRVQQAGEDPQSYYFPGQFAFFKAPPPS